MKDSDIDMAPLDDGDLAEMLHYGNHYHREMTKCRIWHWCEDGEEFGLDSMSSDAIY